MLRCATRDVALLKPARLTIAVELRIRIADETDTAHLVRQRRAMFSEVGVGSENDLNSMSAAVEAYFRQAIQVVAHLER